MLLLLQAAAEAGPRYIVNYEWRMARAGKSRVGDEARVGVRGTEFRETPLQQAAAKDCLSKEC